jgi:hypothetical protein
MGIRVPFNGASLAKPGAYSKTTVNLSGGFPLAATGVIAIVGEALGGAPGSSDGVQTFTSEDIAALVAKYKSGPIVDAARLLVAPARDNRVPNGASLIRVWKTNASTQATRALQNSAPATLFNANSLNYGEDENLINITIANGSSANNKVLTIKKSGVTETLSENAYDAVLSLQYAGADAGAVTMVIQNVSGVKTLTATTSATPADNLAISLAGKTMQDLVNIIDANAAWTASLSTARLATVSAASLDYISTALDVKTTAKTLRRAQQELLDIVASQSELISLVQVANVEGLPANVGPVFLQGAVRGASANSNFQAGFDALLATRCNTVVPLISQDASALIAGGDTDPASAFTVDAVNAQALSHCITASNTKNRSERNCFVSKKGSFAAMQTAAQALNHERASMLFQDVQVLDGSGNLSYKDPWAASCMLAGIQAGTEVGTPATFKFVNANAIRHQDYNSKTQVDLAIDAGLTPLEESDSGGFRVVVGNTTYGIDANFVWNRVSVVYAADYVAYNLRQQLEAIFVGNKAATGTAQAIKNTIISIMDSFLRAQIIVGDDTNDGLGFKNLLVTLVGNTAYVDVTVTPVQGVDFILNRIQLDNIRQSA